MFWPVPPTSYPTQNIIYHWKSHGKEISKSPVSKNKQKILFIKYVSVLYIPLEIPYKENFNKSDKIWPTPPTSCPPQKLVPDTKMAKKWVLIKYGCVIYCWKAHINEILRSLNKKWLPHLLPVWPKNWSMAQIHTKMIVHEAVSATRKTFELSVMSMLLYE